MSEIVRVHIEQGATRTGEGPKVNRQALFQEHVAHGVIAFDAPGYAAID